MPTPPAPPAPMLRFPALTVHRFTPDAADAHRGIFVEPLGADFVHVRVTSEAGRLLVKGDVDRELVERLAGEWCAMLERMKHVAEEIAREKRGRHIG